MAASTPTPRPVPSPGRSNRARRRSSSTVSGRSCSATVRPAATRAPCTSLPARPSIRFGVFDWMDDSGSDLAGAYAQRLKLVELADERGLYAYHLAEHHGTPLGLAPSPNVFLAAAAARTTRLRLGALVNVVPLYDPVRLVEEGCMLDQL